MKLLVDTSVWSLALRRRASVKPGAEESRLVKVLTEAIADGRVTTIGPIRQELLSGIKEAAQFEKVKKALEPFRDETIATADYEEAARLYNLCRSRGVECGPVDVLICAVAWRRQWDLLTSDAVMKRCMEVVRSG
ncbi:MAG TPA: PIN domain-containing protein [Candidatus Bathyarchaeia archaeon]|nr:PIN domain-containing protein [Candidatus Bathyarchaeia archaeon]